MTSRAEYTSSSTISVAPSWFRPCSSSAADDSRNLTPSTMLRAPSPLTDWCLRCAVWPTIGTGVSMSNPSQYSVSSAVGLPSSH
ncbi:Uncharacterised protein [Mycobacteroides abscessus subsp. abscessus]|nr:Uncharacterised protein [Mycobacteroides abscessus subsp. abscessus]